MEAIRNSAKDLGRSPSRSEFQSKSRISEYKVLRYFPSWREAVRAAGLEPDSTNIKLDDRTLLEDWGEIVRRNHQIPTRDQYRREGNYSPGAFEKHFGPWSMIPSKFKESFSQSDKWKDVLSMLPETLPRQAAHLVSRKFSTPTVLSSKPNEVRHKHSKLEDRPTYGDPIDFRGLRHEPVNEQGVVFLFGMVARELGYMVEAVQTGFPDCEAKRQLAGGKWQRVRIEFEFESRNFRDHGHAVDGCDVIVCWRHNWQDCPQNIEVIELESMIKSLSKSGD